MRSTKNFFDENIYARSKPVRAIIDEDVLQESTSQGNNIFERNPLLQDTPQALKDSPLSGEAPVIYTNDDIEPAAIQVGKVPPQPNVITTGNIKYNTPSKRGRLNISKFKKGKEEDLVNFDNSPYSREPTSRGVTPTKRAPSSHDSSVRRSPSVESGPNITPREKLNQIRIERKSDRASDLNVDIADIKLKQEQMHLLPNPPPSYKYQAVGALMKESVKQLCSAKKSQESDMESVPVSNFQVPPASSDMPIKTLAGLDLQHKISAVEEKLEKESEHIKAKISEAERTLSLEERLVEETWQVRRNAYRELGGIFSRDQENAENVPPGEEQVNYTSWLKYIMREGNLVALAEGLNTVHIYAENSPTIGPALGLVPDLLEKMPIHKPQFQEIVTKILCELIKRDQGPYVVNELLSRGVNPKKVTKASIFSIQCLISMLNTPLFEEIDLKQVYREAVKTLNHTQRDIRILIMKLLQVIFELVEDDLKSFLEHLPDVTKPPLIKELTAILKNTEKKASKGKIKLFTEPKIMAQTGGFGAQQPDEPRRVGTVGNPRRKLSRTPESTTCVNLQECVSEEFFKLTYMTKAEEKKQKIEEFNQTLEQILEQQCEVEKKDYSSIIGILCTLLEDTNIFLQLEIMKSVQLLSSILKKEMSGMKSKQLASKLFEKLRENKTSITIQIEETIREMLLNECLLPETLHEVAINKAINSKNPRIRQQSLILFTNLLGEKYKEMKMPIFSQDTILKFFSNGTGSKLLNLVHKDPSAGVRDAAIQILAKIKMYCPNASEVDKIISKLHKSRIQEIGSLLKAEAPESLTPRNQKVEKTSELRRSKSMMKIETPLVEDQLEKVKNLAENGSGETFFTELLKINETEIMKNRPHLLLAITYYFTRKTGKKKNLIFNEISEVNAIKVINFLRLALEKGDITEQELDCGLSLGIILSTKISSLEARHLIFNTAYNLIDMEYMLVSIQRVLYTFKYSDENDSVLKSGMTAYQYVAEWMLNNLDKITREDTERVAAAIELNNGMGFKEEFVEHFNKMLEKIKSRTTLKLEQKEIQEAIVNASSMAMNLRPPTPRMTHQSRTQQKLSQIIQILKDQTKIKKGLEELHVFLDEIQKEAKSNSSNSPSKKGSLIAPISLLLELSEILSKQIVKSPASESELLNIVIKFRDTLSSDEAGKLIKSFLEAFSDIMHPEIGSKKLIEYYKVLNVWAREMKKSEIASVINDIFTGCSFHSDSKGSKVIIQLRALIRWFRTQILGEFFEKEDIEELLTYLVRGLKCETGIKEECEQIISICYKLFGVQNSRTWLEDALSHSQTLYKIYAEWHDSLFKTREIPPVEEAKTNLPDMIARLSQIKGEHVKQVSFDSSSYTPEETPLKGPEKSTLLNSKSPLSLKKSREASPEFSGSLNRSQKESQEIKPPTIIKENIAIQRISDVISPKFGSDTPLSIKELEACAAHSIVEEILNDSFKFQNSLYDCPAPERKISKPIIEYFQKSESLEERVKFSKMFSFSLGNEDFIQTLPQPTLSYLIDACLKMCAIEKQRLTLKDPSNSTSNEVITELQNSLTKLVNSNTFTVTLNILLFILQEYLPIDFTLELTQEQIIYLKLLMICIQKTFRAACGEDAKFTHLKSFNVLLSMHKLFLRHPPEKLKQSLPSLPVFDYIYKILREITDAVLQSDMDKGYAFIKWVEQSKEKDSMTFLKYIKNVLARLAKANQ